MSVPPELPECMGISWQVTKRNTLGYKQDEYCRQELEWYYNFSDSDCGIKSNWSAMVQAAHCPGGVYVDPYSSFILRAVEKRREIEKSLWTLSSNLQNCLSSVFGSHHMPHPIVQVFGELAGPVICLGFADLEKLCNRKILGKATTKETLTISELRIQAEALKNNSFTEYRRNRNAKKDP